MKKYLEVYRLSFKMQIVWRFDVAMTMAATAGRIIAACILWQAIFSNMTAVKGFSLTTMLSYYIISSILASIDFSHQVSGEVSYLVRSGRFSGHMVMPMNPLAFFGSMTLGETAFHSGFSLLAAIVCAFIFGVGITVTGGIAQTFLAVAIILIGLIFMICYHFFIGILAFKYTEIDFFMHVQGSIIAFVTGSLVPLSLLPEAALSLLRLLPFTHVVYTPVMLLCGQLSLHEGLFSLAIIALWTFGMFAIGQYTYRHLRVKYDGVGI